MERSGKDFYEKLAQRGYIVAVQDVRGRFNSDGEFFPYFNEHDDGYDTVEWIAAQDWCDGNIGMTGGSYVGQTPWFAASRRPPHLKAIVPIVSPPGTSGATSRSTAAPSCWAWASGSSAWGCAPGRSASS